MKTKQNITTEQHKTTQYNAARDSNSDSQVQRWHTKLVIHQQRDLGVQFIHCTVQQTLQPVQQET